MALFEVAILQKPTKKEKEDGELEKLVFGPTTIIAKDSQSAAIETVMDNAGDLQNVDRKRMEILVRSFG